jgi:4-alpha-glucanotransferase
MDFFRALSRGLGGLPIVAEDLGVITPEVDALREEAGLPGMKVLQFAFDEDDSTHMPHHHPRSSVVYTGTHDNDTTASWYRHLGEASKQRLCDYVGRGGEPIHWKLIRTAYTSPSDLAVVPLQDVLGLGARARMNTPGRSHGNWAWRLVDMPGAEEATRLRRLAELTGRLRPS